jgi:imidazole glycerol phosphate synthase subunit HisF
MSHHVFATGVNGKCLPAKAFNPSNLSTDQWVRTARDMGAGEICLTAHHEVREPRCPSHR